MDAAAELFGEELQDFYDNVENKIILALSLVVNHTLEIGELRGKVYPANTTGQPLDQTFNRAIGILTANNFIKINGHFVTLDDRGYRIFEVLDDTQLSAPYTSFATREKRLQDNSDRLLEAQLLNAEQQNQLHPLMVSANQSTIETNRNIVRSNNITRGILLLTVFITLANVVIAIMSYNGDQSIKVLREELGQKDSIIQSLSKQPLSIPKH